MVSDTPAENLHVQTSPDTSVSTEFSRPARGGRADGIVRLVADAIDWRSVEGEIVALDRAGSVYLAINPAGAALWPALVGGATIDELVAILLERFDVEPGQARGDVSAFVAELAERDLLER